jgi:hypothetical protein
MSDFPRTVTPASVTELELPGPLITVSQSGKITKRATQQLGRRWTETYTLNTQLTAHKGFLAVVRNLWRNGTDFDISHIDYLVPKGTIGGSPLVQGATQLVTDPENFGAWTQVGTVGITTGQADPLGGTAASLLEDDAAGTAEAIYEVVTFTADATKCAALYVKAGTATATTFRIVDVTAGSAILVQIGITWSAGVPTPSVGAGSGSVFLAETTAVSGWYRIPFTVNSIVAAHTNRWEIYPSSTTSANVGTVYAFGANAWNEVSPARYSGPSQPLNDVIGNVLYVNGATASVSNWLRAGDLISAVVGSGIGVWEATADVNSQTSGYVAIPINPPIYTGFSPADNAAVTVTGVKMRACIIAPPTFPDTSGNSNDYGTLTLQFAEVV